MRRATIAAVLRLGCSGGSGTMPVIPCDLEQRCPGALTCDRWRTPAWTAR